jgi:hypothetical protein
MRIAPILMLKSLAAAALLVGCATTPPTGPMSFFVTSVGSGNGANLGGLDGADAHCKKLATAAGAGNRNWRAYLSNVSVEATAPAQPTPAVHARDRVGTECRVIVTSVLTTANGRLVFAKPTTLAGAAR